MADRQKTLIFAHRGANREAAENTRSAFEHALAYAVDGIETDVQLSRDEIPVLWHDRFLAQLGWPLKRIDDFNWAQLQKMHFLVEHTEPNQSQALLRLDEFVASYRQRCGLLIEIKNRDWEEKARHQIKVRLTLAILGVAAGSDIMVSSFNLPSLIYAHQCAPKFPLIYNVESDQDVEEVQRVLAEQPFLYGLCLPIAILDQQLVDLLRGQGKKIAIYTCNSDQEINRALNFGVDILITDVPQQALRMRDQ